MRPMVRYRCVSEVAREASMRPSPDKNPPTITTGRVPYMLLRAVARGPTHTHPHTYIHTHTHTHTDRPTHRQTPQPCNALFSPVNTAPCWTSTHLTTIPDDIITG